MKKRLFFFVGIFACMLFALVGCRGTKLDRPSALYLDSDSYILSWNQVTNANEYQIEAGEKSFTTRRTSYNLSELDAGNYAVRVRAVDRAGVFSPSDWSATVNFINENDKNDVVYELSKDGSHYEVLSVGVAKGDVVVRSTYHGKPVTTISRRAFKSDAITSITIEEGVTTIEDYAFQNCISLESITIPETVTKIGRYAFQSCYALTDVSLPSSLTEISDYMFSYCSALSRVDVPTSVQKIGKSAFNKCTLLSEMILPDTVTEIGESAFSDCSSLYLISMGTNVRTIGEKAFTRCTSLASFDIPDSVSEIGADAFYKCSGLTEIEIPDSVVSIGDDAFNGCVELKDIELGKGIMQIGQRAFTETKHWSKEGNFVYVGKWLVDCKDFETSVDENGRLDIKEDTVGIADYTFNNNEKIQQLIFPDSVRAVGALAFANCKNLIVVKIGATTEILRKQAFYNCALLASVSFEGNDALHTIEPYAFAECKLLSFSTIIEKGIELPQSVVDIGSYAFFRCSALETIDLPDGLQRIGARAFNETGMASKVTTGFIVADNWIVGSGDMLTTAYIPNYIVGIADYTFFNLANLQILDFQDAQIEHIGKASFLASAVNKSDKDENIVIPGSMKKIEDYAFWGSLVQSVTLSEGTEVIGRSAFYGCMYMKSITLPNTLKRIEKNAFYSCYSLAEIVIPASVEYIDEFAFANCINLKKVTVLGDGLKEIGTRAFSQALSLTNLSLGKGIEKIGEKAFYENVALKTLVFPDSLKEIGARAFYKCSALENISFGSSLERIGEYAFGKCIALDSVIFPESLVSIGNYAFYNCALLNLAVVGDSVQYMGTHVFYGCTSLIIYTNLEELPTSWTKAWNTSYRPIVRGCTFSDDKSYLVAVTVFDVLNNPKGDITFTPKRDGYTFVGWTSVAGSSEVEYTAETFADAPQGTLLVAVWQKI